MSIDRESKTIYLGEGDIICIGHNDTLTFHHITGATKAIPVDGTGECIKLHIDDISEIDIAIRTLKLYQKRNSEGNFPLPKMCNELYLTNWKLDLSKCELNSRAPDVLLKQLNAVYDALLQYVAI